MNNDLLEFILLWLVRLAATIALWIWLRKDLTPRRLLSFFESEGSLSIRLALAAVVALYALFMRHANQLTTPEAVQFLQFVEILLGIGAAKLAVKAIAERPASPPAQIKADKAAVDVAGDLNLTAPPKSTLAGYTDPHGLANTPPRQEYNMNQP